MQLACSGLQLKSSAERSFVQMQAVVVSSGSPCTKLFPIHGILQVTFIRRENEGWVVGGGGGGLLHIYFD